MLLGKDVSLDVHEEFTVLKSWSKRFSYFGRQSFVDKIEHADEYVVLEGGREGFLPF